MLSRIRYNQVWFRAPAGTIFFDSSDKNWCVTQKKTIFCSGLKLFRHRLTEFFPKMLHDIVWDSVWNWESTRDGLANWMTDVIIARSHGWITLDIQTTSIPKKISRLPSRGGLYSSREIESSKLHVKLDVVIILGFDGFRWIFAKFLGLQKYEALEEIEQRNEIFKQYDCSIFWNDRLSDYAYFHADEKTTKTCKRGKSHARSHDSGDSGVWLMFS